MKEQKQDDHDDEYHDGGEPPQDTTVETGSSRESSESSSPNQGKLLLDATCAPADIAYPTDLSLLNEAREKMEGMIDLLHAPFRGQKRKPHTYRQKARCAI